jgi:ABC-2 type transport system permease protein
MTMLLVTLAIIATSSGLVRQSSNDRAVSSLLEAEAQLRSSLRARLERPASSVASKPGALGFSVLSEHVALTHSASAPLAVGSAGLLPDLYRFDAHASYLQQGRGDLENPLRLSVGSFDLSFVLVFVVPIMVIALSYDMVSREKESGVLALACAQGVDPKRLIYLKLMARCLASLLPVTLAIGASFSLLALAGAQPEWATVFAWWCVSLVYTGFWFALAAGVNALNRDSATNGVILANLWLLLVVIIPAAISLAATGLFPAPSRVALTTELREAASETEARAAAAREQYFFDHPDLSAAEPDQEIYFEAVARSETAISGSIAAALQAFDLQAGKQARLAERWQYLSPALVFQQSLSRLVGSDRDAYVAFRTAAFAHHTRWRQFFITALESGNAMTLADWDRLPRFDWTPSSTADRIRSTLGAVAWLLAMMSLLLMLARWQFRRYPVV